MLPIAGFTAGDVLTDAEALALAVSCARQGVRSANPLVGAVITDSAGRLLYAGWHRGAGTAHAEADALAQAARDGVSLQGASMFVSLEPCNHTGRTGPCSRAVLDAGIGRLVYAHRDDTAQAAGGAAFLESRGVQVEYVPRQDAADLNRRWFQAMAENRPWVTAKIASTLDGFIAAADGTSQWITGEAARADGHLLRSRVDAIAVGTETALADNPRLSARTADGTLLEKQPLPVIVGRRNLPSELYLSAALEAGSALQIRTHHPREVLNALYAQGVRHLLLEGGPTLISAFLRANLVDEIFWYQAPLLLGAGRRGVGELGITSLSGAQQWEPDDLGTTPAHLRLGQDTRLHLTPRTNPS